MDDDTKLDFALLNPIQNNADLWQFAESIQDNLDKLNALVDAMTGEDFQQIRANSQASYLSVLMDYLQILEDDFGWFREYIGEIPVDVGSVISH